MTLSVCQYAFRRDRNISEVVFDVHKEIDNSVTEVKRSLFTFLYLQKAYDLVNRERLTDKLEINMESVLQELFRCQTAESEYRRC